MGQITATQNLVAIKEVRHAGQWRAVGAAPFQKQRRGSELVKWHEIWVRGRMKAKQRWFKATRELCHEWFHHVRHHVHDWLVNSPQSFDVYSVSQSRSVVTSACPRRIRPQRTRFSQLENSAMGTWPIYKNYYTRLVRKMAWYKIQMHALIV